MEKKTTQIKTVTYLFLAYTVHIYCRDQHKNYALYAGIVPGRLIEK
jgi:hypothetical protein